VHDGWFTKQYMKLAEMLDRRFGWDELPEPLALFTLIGIRVKLRRRNLYDTTGVRVGWGPEQPKPGRSLVRAPGGVGTDPNHPDMGAAGTRFGRNVPPEGTYPDRVLEPNPRVVSNELLARKEFIPAASVNLLVAAWLQFEVHDWMSHGSNPHDDPYEVDVSDDDPWPEHPMRIRRTRPDPTSDGGPPTYRNTESHWWDASQVYGSSPAIEKMLRTHSGGHLKLTPDGVVPFDPPNMPDIPGVDLDATKGNWWLGLAMFHTLFMREHNAICDHLASSHPEMDDQQLFDHGRLVIAALIAKIHTVEWTTAILADSTMETGMRVNWWGVQGEAITNRFGRLTKSEELSGIIGSDLYHHGVPFAMTEEFVSVYRMHPLIPDDYSLRSVLDDEVVEEVTFDRVAGVRTHEMLEHPQLAMHDFFYSFGTSNPGAIVLHNYPNHLRSWHEADGHPIDLAAIDVLRNRERGVPRYNEFRRKFHLAPARRFEDFSSDPRVVSELRRVYRSPEDVDLMVGLYTETPPTGFAISDTAFRVFIVMASRRLKSDRFFTYDYRPEVYTHEGLQWIADNTLSTVLLRHYPALAPVLDGIDNPFKPWNRSGPT
jgi:hypothetical protein